MLIIGQIILSYKIVNDWTEPATTRSSDLAVVGRGEVCEEEENEKKRC